MQIKIELKGKDKGFNNIKKSNTNKLQFLSPIKKSKNNYQLLNKQNQESFTLNTIEDNKTEIKIIKYKSSKIITHKIPNRVEDEENEDFNNNNNIRLQELKIIKANNLKLLIIILNQLFKSKKKYYQKDLLNRLNINLIKIRENEISKIKKEEYEKKEKENKLILIKKEKKIIQTSPKERSKLYSTTKNSLNFISEKPKLIIKKKNLQSFSSNKNYSNNYTQILIEYLKKRIALTNWYNKMMALKNSKKIRIIGRKIGEGISKNKIIKNKTSFKIKLLKFPFEQIKREAKRRILIKAFLNIQNLQYPSLEFALMKIKKYTEIKYQVMNAYATIIQRNFRYYIQYVKNKNTTITIIEQTNTVIESVQYKRRKIYRFRNLKELFNQFYKKKLVKNVIELLYFKSY